MATGNSLENLEAILETEKEEENDESSDEGSDGEEEGSDDDEDTDEEDDNDGDGEEEEEGEDFDDNEESVEAEVSEDEDDDGEEDDDEEEEDEEEEEEGDVKEEDGDQAKQLDGSDSGGEDVDNCPICLSGLRSQDIGTPESCDHTFCLECIQEWAKNVNTCPVDRQVFHLILARHAGKEKIFKQFPVADKEQENEEEEDDPTYCEICGQSNQEDRLLLCDGCDLGYHCDCLTPPLAQVPVDAWFCPQCQARRGIIDAPVDINLPRQARRQIGRTLISERVRRLIQDARAERAERRQRVAEMIEAQEEMGELDEAGPSSETPAHPRPVRQRKSPSTTRKKKTTKRKTKRKTTRKKTTTKRKTKGKKRVTRKRKTSKKGKGKGKKCKKTTKKKTASSPSAARTVSLPSPSTVKGRIADRLGLSKPPVGRAIPLQKVTSGTGSAREGPHKPLDVGQSSFSILGNKDELYSFAEKEGEERQIVNRPAIPAEQILSQSPRLPITPSKKKVEVSNSAASTSSVGFDLLGSILMNQDLLAKGGRHITINRDGSLSAKNSGTASSSPKKNVSDKASSSSVQTSSVGSSSSTSISNKSGSNENRQDKSSLTNYNSCEVEPSPKKVVSNDFNDASLSPESQPGVKGQTCSLEDSTSDEELLNFCLKSEGLDFQREGEVTDGGNVCHDTNPSGSASLAFQEDQEGNADQSPHLLHQSSQAPDETVVECAKTLPNLTASTEGSREEGEATDSNEEGEIVSEDEVDNVYRSRNCEGDEEEGEIIEEDEKRGSGHYQSESKSNRAQGAGPSDFAATEVMKLSTANEGCTLNDDGNSEIQTSDKQNNLDIDIADVKKEVEEDDEEEEEEDFDPYDPKNGSFLVARFLHSLVTNEFDRKKVAAQRREERERAREEEERRKKESEKDLSDHKISILDFIGNAGARFGVVADSQNNRPQGRGRGRGTIRPVHFGARRTSNDEDSKGSRARGMRENSFTPKRNGYEERAPEKMGERPYFHDRNYPGVRSDLNGRRSHSQRSDSPERTGSRRIRGEKRKRENSESHNVNGHFERDRGKRSYMARDKRRRYEERNERRSPKYHRRRASEENSGSGSSSSSSGSDSEEGSSSGSSSSGNSPTKPTEVPAVPSSPDDSPCPTPPSVPPPPPPPLPRSPSPQPPPPPPPQTSPPQNYIPRSAPSQHNYAPNHSSVKTHSSYSHPNTAPSSAPQVPGQPHPSAHPSTYPHRHPVHTHPSSSSSQNPPVHHPGGYPHPQGSAYSSSSYPHGYPYYPHSHPHASSYYPRTTQPASQQRPGAPAASTHPHAATYPHYQMRHPSTSYSSTSSTVPHPQRYSAHYPTGHAQQAATSHPQYYSGHPSMHPHPVPHSYPYPNHQHPTTSATHISHPSQPHPSQSASNSHSSSVVRNEHSFGAMQNMTNSQSQRHLKRSRESPSRFSPKMEVKSARLGYRPSPPTVRGVATSDRVASNILHDEVKKGFRQLVEDAVRSALRPAWSTKRVSKEAYKDIFKKCVEKVCGSKETVVQQDKIQSLVDAYIFKARKTKN